MFEIFVWVVAAFGALLLSIAAIAAFIDRNTATMRLIRGHRARSSRVHD